MEQTRFDVFISYSRKDYVENDEIIPGNPITAIMECFDKNGVSYWIDKKGIYAGQEFMKVIKEAITNSKMLVFISSKHSNESNWTANEIIEAKDKNKHIIPFLIDGSPYNNCIEEKIKAYSFINYCKQPLTAFEELLRAVNIEKEKITRQELNVDVENFKRLKEQQDILLRSIYSKSKDVGAKTKRCPVCYAEMPVKAQYCELCGWHFASLYGVFGIDGRSLHDEKQLQIVHGLWQRLHEGKDTAEKLRSLQVGLEKILKESKSPKDKTFAVDAVQFKMIRVDGYSSGLFYIGETQVTQAMWQAVMGNDNNPSEFKGLDHPVECVSWNDICGKNGTGTDPNCFLFKLRQKVGVNFMLPTEAQWEYAAKGGNMGKDYTYAGSDDIDKVAWYWKNSGDKYLKGSDDDWELVKVEENKEKTHPVKKMHPNELGIYDMSGNVWEWCEDFYDSKDTKRVIRGGSWGGYAKCCKVDFRWYCKPEEGRKGIGFRLALVLP